MDDLLDYNSFTVGGAVHPGRDIAGGAICTPAGFAREVSRD